METATEHEHIVEEPTDALTEVAGSSDPENEAALKERPAIFSFADYVDLPFTCTEEVQKRGSCDAPDHFHAWFRLPNKFQHKELRDKALAAKARKMRQMRDQGSDAFEVLEQEMDLLQKVNKDLLVDEIVEQDAWKDQVEAMKDVSEIEAEDQPEDAEETILKYAGVEEDRKVLDALENQPEDERDNDEFESLLKHVTAYYEEIDRLTKERQEPRRTALLEKSQEELVDLVRDIRINTSGLEAFMHTYNTWGMLVGALKSDKSGRVYGDLEHMKSAAPEVIEALEEAQRRLEREAQGENP